MSKKHKLICIGCGKEYMRDRGSGKYCSRSCSNRHRNWKDRPSDTESVRFCPKCHMRKKIDDFYDSGTWCKECFSALVRNNYLKRTYGIDDNEYREILASQDGGCWICGKKGDQKSNGIKMLAVDHEKKSGKIRGILCENCNRGIGLFNDRVDLLERAIEYLNQF